MNATPHVLIVDDELVTRNTLRGMLLAEGYKLSFAVNGREALAQVGQEPPDVILLDVMMPEMDGFEVCQHLKSDPRWQHIPIILVTALDSKEDLAHGLDSGADEFISKPVTTLELQARVRSMLRIKKQYDDLMMLLQLREDLANMIVHDMRSPLTVILGYSDSVQRRLQQKFPEEIVPLQKIYRQAQRLQGFANDMLMLTKMERGQLVLQRSLVDVNQLIKTAEPDYQILAEARGMKLEVILPAEQPRPVDADPVLLQRVLDNLLANAFKYAPGNSLVVIKVEYPASDQLVGPQLRLKVMDEGPGIPEENWERIFEKYEIVALKKSSLAQVGLGLAFCKMVAEMHGGQIFYQPNQPVGSVFVVEI